MHSSGNSFYLGAAIHNTLTAQHQKPSLHLTLSNGDNTG